MRFITLSAEDQARLRSLHKAHHVHKVRMRAQALLMSDKGYKIAQIADCFDLDRDTVSSWFTRWEDEGIQGLSDHPRSGRPPSLDQGTKKKF